MAKIVMHIVQAAGGVERYLDMLLRNMDKVKYKHILVCTPEYSQEKYLSHIYAYEQVEMGREVKLLDDLKAVIQVRKIIEKYTPDIIYLHSSKAGAIGRIANLGIKNKVIYNPHGWAFNMQCGKIKRRLYCLIEKVLSPFADKIIAISDYEKGSAIEKKIAKKEKIQVIYNGIDIDQYDIMRDEFSITRKQLGISDEDYLIGCVGRLTKQKASDTFIKVASCIKKYIPNAYFIMIGDGEDREEIEKMVQSLGLEQCVYITGWIENPMEYIVLLDQAVLLSRWEGFGLVLAEYMWAEKPIIATRVDAIPNIIKDGVNGLLVECDNVDEIVDKNLEVYNNDLLKNRLIRQAKKDVTNLYSVKRVVNEHLALFDSLLCI